MLIFLTFLFFMAGGSPLTYLIQQDKTKEAFEYYEAHVKENDKHNAAALQQMAYKLIEQGLTSDNPETEIVSLFGAGVAMNDRLIPLIEDKFKSRNPQIQLIALLQLSKAGHYLTSEALQKALRSDFLLIRLEALFLLAEKKASITASQTEALMQKTPDEMWEVYPPILALCKDRPCLQMLKRLLMHPNQRVRLSTLLSIKNNEIYEFMPLVRSFATHSDPAELEAAAATLGLFKDRDSIGLLTRLTRSPHPQVRLSALFAIYQLGKVEMGQKIAEEAKKGDLFAVTLLGKIEGGEKTLLELVAHSDMKVSLNAALALLKHKQKQGLKPLLKLMTDRGKDPAILPIVSDGRTLTAYKIVPSAKEQFQDNPALMQLSQATWHAALIDALELEENALVAIAKELIEKEQDQYIPLIINLLENSRTPEAIALLKKERERPGAPLVRGMCTLSLFRIEEEGPYKQELKKWVLSSVNQPLFHCVLPGKRPIEGTATPHGLTPDQTSALFIEAIESICLNDRDLSIDLLYEAIKNGHPDNRPALAALLLRTLQ